jgi:hypothetical protein
MSLYYIWGEKGHGVAREVSYWLPTAAASTQSFMWDLWKTNQNEVRLTPSSYISLATHSTYCSTRFWAGAICQIVAHVPNELSLNPHNKQIKANQNKKKWEKIHPSLPLRAPRTVMFTLTLLCVLCRKSLEYFRKCDAIPTLCLYPKYYAPKCINFSCNEWNISLQYKPIFLVYSSCKFLKHRDKVTPRLMPVLVKVSLPAKSAHLHNIWDPTQALRWRQKPK